jgi:molybdopterin-guanine dinucleotide biosynthesis protein A
VAPDLAAIVLAGGAARRWGGRHKPAIPVAGTPMLDRVLAAVPQAWPRVVVGPAQTVPDDVVVVQEDPPLGGPAAAIAAGAGAVLAAVGRGGSNLPGAPSGAPSCVAVLAGDQPLLSAEAVAVLLDEVRAAPADIAGAVYADGGRPQLLCGVWRLPVLAGRCAEAGGAEGKALAGCSVRALLAPLRHLSVVASADPPPWYDCDTPDAAARAAALLRDTRSRPPGAEPLR